MDKVFFANSGAEANEGAIKAARRYSRTRHGTGRHTIVSLVNSFHGRTMATLTATGQTHFHRDFEPCQPGLRYVPAGDAAALRGALDETVCAVMLEPVQGEGGVLPLDAAYLRDVQALCRQNDVLLIADEVQCGVGRSGAFLASGKLGLAPDIVTLAKGLGGGLPIGAVLFAAGCADALGKGDHATTFGANPVCCAGALAVMERLDDAFLAGVETRGRRLRAGLEALPQVAGVTGLGLMLGARLAEGLHAGEVVQRAIGNGLLMLTAGDRLRFLPPLVITGAEIDEGITILKKTLEELA
jgi:acetylornithine/N-succinyldiaminopimelate aminotransferase